VKPSKTVDAFLRGVESGDIDRAATLFSSGFISQRGVEMLKSDLRDVSLELKEHGGIKSIKLLKEDVIGDVAEVTVEVRRGNGYIVTVHYKLVKENRSWRIDDIAGGPGHYESAVSVLCREVPYVASAGS
jgi:Domain of unknown function (DUF4878)